MKNKSQNITDTGWFKLVVVISIFLCVVKLYNYFYRFEQHALEGFDNNEDKYVVKTNVDIYDKFYVSIYDELVYNPIRTEFEIGHIISATSPTRESLILDIGCGTGHRQHELAMRGFKNSIGIDKSKDMIAQSVAKYPHCKFYVADIMNISGFPFNPATYTHIMCLYFTLYYMQDKYVFFNNCYKLLKSGGSLIIHLVDRNQFDPILPPGNPFLIISPQGYTPNRITNTKIQFHGFNYGANFQLDKQSNTAVFEEVFKFDNPNKVRIHKHMLYMNPINDILLMAKNAGFIIKAKIDMLECAYDYQYLYVLYKPA